MFNECGSVLEQTDGAVACAPLAMELQTGNLTIDGEHRQLYALLQTARSICLDMAVHRDCRSCSEARRAHCENALVKVLGDLLIFILDHFKTEESIMRESLLIMIDRLLCETHMEDHAAISAKIERIIAALDPLQTVSQLRELDTVLGRWATLHIATHDMALVNWIEREDSALRSSF